MGWRNWPYWLRGGVIGAFIAFILFLLLLFFELAGRLGNPFPDAIGYLFFPLFPAFALSALSCGVWYSTCSFLGTMTYIFIEAIIIYFAIGSLIGLIIGKIKQRKRG